MADKLTLRPRPLTADDFAPFGDVIDSNNRSFELINNGTARKYAGLATIDISAQEGTPAVSIYHANPMPEPLTLTIPMRLETDSLNVAVASGIFLYHFTRESSLPYEAKK